MISKKTLRLLSAATMLSTVASLTAGLKAEATIVDGATYYYTTDNSDPTTSSTRKEWSNTATQQVITAPDTDTASNVTVKVVAVKDGITSDVVSKTITFAAKAVIEAPILNPNQAQTYPNRDTLNYIDITNVNDTGVNYYYTTDESIPSKENGTQVVSKSIILNGPDTDVKTTYNVKVIAEKKGVYSNVSTLRVTYSAKTGDGTGGPIEGTITNPVISFSKLSPYNRQSGIKAFVTGKKSGVDYYYTTDGTEPGTAASKLTSSYIDVIAPDIDAEENVAIWVKGFKDGYNDDISTVSSITFAKKERDKFYVTFKDRTYNDIETVEYRKGDAILSNAPAAPIVDGYTFIGWSNEDANVEKNMIVRAMYEKDTVSADVHNPSETVILADADSSDEDQVLITNSWPGTSVRIYVSDVNDNPHYDGVVDASGECTIKVGKLAEAGGQVWVAYDTDTATSRALTARKPVSYPSRATAQIYSLPIPASRLVLETASTLIVRGVDSGEVVNVYNKDNELIGSSKQGRAPLMSIDLGESVSKGNVYVARVTPGRLESQQTELTESDIMDNTVMQSLLNVKQQIESAFKSSNFDKTTVESAIEDLIGDSIVINGSPITGNQYNFVNNDGHITVSVHLENTATFDELDFSLDKDFSASAGGPITGDSNGTGSENSDLTVEQALEIIRKLNPDLFDEDSDISEILSEVSPLLPSRVNVNLTVFNNDGNKITFNAVVKDEKNNSATGDITYDYNNDNSGSGGDNGSGSDNGSGGGSTSDDKVEVTPSGDSLLDEIAQKIKEYLDKYKPTNDSSNSYLNGEFEGIVAATTDAGVYIEVKDWNKKDATKADKGNLEFNVAITDDTDSEADVSFSKTIEKLASDSIGDGNGGNGSEGGNGNEDNGNGGNGNGGNGSGEVASEFDKCVERVKDYLDDLNAKNTTSKSAVNGRIEDICDDYGINSTINDWNLDKSTTKSKGNLSFTVTLTKGEESKTLSYDDDISKKSSSSSSSSGGSSSDNSSSSDSGSNTSNGGGNILSTPIGTVGNSSTLTDSNGNKIGISDVTDSDGNNTGNKVTASKGGNVAVKVNGGSGGASSVLAIYKYESITGRYIQLPEGFVVSGAYVQFTAEAGAEYFVAKKLLPAELLLIQGWNKLDKGTYLVNGLNTAKGWAQIGGKWFYLEDTSRVRIESNWKQVNGKWYYLGLDGVMQKGWISDKGNWYYLNPWSGDMAKGWKQVGSEWYYLHADNGAMQTGWRQIGYHWFYMHEDGHMAASEAINGYNLNSDGRWVK